MKILAILLLLAMGVCSQSCTGRCGTKDDSQPCQCDTSCKRRTDCCTDYKTICYSCEDRCGEEYLSAKPCQCNDDCRTQMNCCSDYTALCTGEGATDAELRDLTETLFEMDVNNVFSQITVDPQGQGTSGDLASKPYFTNVPPSALSGPTFVALRNLQDNYFADVSMSEIEDSVEVEEQEAFLDTVMDTDVMRQAESFLIEKEIYMENLREKMKEIWFTFYDRTGKLSSSGFEHVFVGEIRKSEVIGLHNWVYFYNEELAGNLDYEGWSKVVSLGDKGEVLENHFEWLGKAKPIGGMFIGTSPELDLAVFTVCFLTRPNSLCPVQMNNQKFRIQTWTQNYGGKVLVGSTYPSI